MRIAIGVFAGVFDENGRLLLRRRERENPATEAIPYEGDWELPGGTVEEDNVWQASSERLFGQELAREVEEETGLSIEVPPMPVMFPAVYINKDERRVDLAFVMPVGVVSKRPATGQCIYVSPEELREIAARPQGEQIVSGWGARMCRMALMALCNSPNLQYVEEARTMLLETQKAMANR